MGIKYIVATYLADRAYGGAEEGGWWYECGELIRQHLVTGSEEKASAFARRLNDKLDATLNRGRRDIGSVLSDGIYRAQIFEDIAPPHYPAERPHYE